MEEDVQKVIEKVQIETGHKFTFDELVSVIQYTVRKLEVIKKDRDYFPLLLETELEDFLMRRAINEAGRMNRCANCATTLPV